MTQSGNVEREQPGGLDKEGSAEKFRRGQIKKKGSSSHLCCLLIQKSFGHDSIHLILLFQHYTKVTIEVHELTLCGKHK